MAHCAGMTERLCPWMQVAKQQGEYMAELLKHGKFDVDRGLLDMSDKQTPFK